MPRLFRPRRLRSCDKLGLGNIAIMLANTSVNEVDLVESVLGAPGIGRIASSPSAARKIHEMVVSILDRVAGAQKGEPHLFIELANTLVLAKYQAERRQISECYADIVDYVVRYVSDLLRRGDPAASVFARRARLVFDALIVGIAGKK